MSIKFFRSTANYQRLASRYFAKGFVMACLLTLSINAFAQPYTSKLGRFQVDQKVGCAPFTVTITKTNLQPGHDCGTTTCQMTFEPTVIEQNTFTYTYNAPGTYDLMVLYPSTIGEAADDIIITVLPNIPPDFEIFTCSGNGVSIVITDKNYSQYFVDFGDGTAVVELDSGNNPTTQHVYPGSNAYNISLHGRKAHAADNCNSMVKGFNALLVLPAPFITKLTAVDVNNLKVDFTSVPNIELQLQIAVNNSSIFQSLQTLYGVSTTNVPSLDLSKNYYCFRLNAHDPCTGNNTPSNIICTQKFTVTPISDDNQLAWITTGTIPSFSISRDSSLLSTTATNSYDDTNIVCNTNYCYQIVSNYADGSVSISLAQCVTSFSSKIPTLINNTSAVVSTAGVALSWLQDPTYSTSQYALFRNASHGDFAFLANAPGTSFADATYTTAGDFCYEITYTDQCKNNSPAGSMICPVRLLGTLDKTNAIHLTWNGYKGWKNGVSSYKVDKFDKTGTFIKSIYTGLDTLFIDSQIDTANQIVSYKVTATANDGSLTTSISNIATFTKEADLFSPTAFTPDHNNLNDNFTVRGFFITRLELHIFNRWGTLIFATDKNERWDGTYNGKTMPNDTYVWTANITDSAGQNFSRSGTVVLLTTRR